MKRIFKLYPVGKNYIWGGKRLESEYGKQMAINPLAECWECSTHPDGVSKVLLSNGSMIPLIDILRENPQYLGNYTNAAGELPILIKFIDANENLSIQVHPNDEYAMEYELQNGKNEFWYIIDSANGAELVLGFEHPITPQQLRASIAEGDIEKHLHKVYPKKGDFYFVSAGTIHAIGKGNLIVEVQQISNVTYRLYDYERKDLAGKKRELQIEKALDVLNYNVQDDKIKKPRCISYHNGFSEEVLCDCSFFKIRRIVVNNEFCFRILSKSFAVFVCLRGTANIIDEYNEYIMTIHKGETVFVPADDNGELIFSGETELLEVFM